MHNEGLYGLHSSPYGQMAGLSEGGNKPSNSIEGVESLGYLQISSLFKDSAALS
jgi:hypothetical protein